MKTQNGENIMDQTDSDQNSVVDDDSNALAPALAEESNRTVQEIVSKHGLKSNFDSDANHISRNHYHRSSGLLASPEKPNILQRMGHDHGSTPNR